MHLAVRTWRSATKLRPELKPHIVPCMLCCYLRFLYCEGQPTEARPIPKPERYTHHIRYWHCMGYGTVGSLCQGQCRRNPAMFLRVLQNEYSHMVGCLVCCFSLLTAPFTKEQDELEFESEFSHSARRVCGTLERHFEGVLFHEHRCVGGVYSKIMRNLLY